MREIREILLFKSSLNTDHLTDNQILTTITPRIQELNLSTIENYLSYLKENTEEIFELYFLVRNIQENTKNIILGEQKSSQRLSIPTENLPGVAYQQTLNGESKYLFISKNIETLTGFSVNDFISNKVDLRNLITQKHRKEVIDKIAIAQKSASGFELTYPIKCNDKIKWIWEQGLFVNTDSKDTKIEGILLDITNQVVTENKLKESKNFIEQITASIPNVVYVFDLVEQEYIFENARAKTLLGHSKESKYTVDNYFRDLVHPHDHELVENFRKKAAELKNENKLEADFRVMNAQNQWIWVRVTEKVFRKNHLGKSIKNIGIIQDITNRKANEQKILNSEMNLRSLIDNSSHYYHLLDTNYRIIIVNKLVELNTKQVTNKEIRSGMDIRNFIPNSEMNAFNDHYQQALTGETINVEKKLSFGPSFNRTFNLKYIPAYDDRGKIFGVVMSSIDITKNINLYQDLQQSNNLLKSINQNIKEGLYRSTEEKGIVYANKAFLEMFGYSMEEITSGSFNSDVLYVNPDRRAELAAMVIANKSFKNEEVQFKHKDGHHFWALVSSILSKTEDGKTFFDGAIRDINEQKRISKELEAAKKRAEEMNRLKGNFLANMSHEIRTPINGIIGLTQIIEMEDDINEMKNHLGLLRTSGERLLNTITSILDLSRLEAQEAEFELSSSVKVNTVINETFNFYESTRQEKGN